MGKHLVKVPTGYLKQIEKAGSLHQAAIDLNISYRKAWMTLQNAEKKLGFALIDRKVGGVAGGGSHITPLGKKFLKSYEKFRTEIEKVLEKTYQKTFWKIRQARARRLKSHVPGVMQKFPCRRSQVSSHRKGPFSSSFWLATCDLRPATSHHYLVLFTALNSRSFSQPSPFLSYSLNF